MLEGAENQRLFSSLYKLSYFCPHLFFFLFSSPVFCYLFLSPAQLVSSALCLLKPFFLSVWKLCKHCLQLSPSPHLPQFLLLYASGLQQNYSTGFNRFWPIYKLFYMELYSGEEISRKKKELFASRQIMNEKHSTFTDL